MSRVEVELKPVLVEEEEEGVEELLAVVPVQHLLGAVEAVVVVEAVEVVEEALLLVVPVRHWLEVGEVGAVEVVRAEL